MASAIHPPPSRARVPGLGSGCGLGQPDSSCRGQRPVWGSLDSLGKAAEPPGCMLRSPTSPIPVRDTAVAKPRETAHAHQSPGAQHGHRSPHSLERQFIMSSALSQQGFPAEFCAPISMCSHRLQGVPFPCGYPNLTRSSDGACRLSQSDPHTQGPAPGLVGGFQGTPVPVKGAVLQCQSCTSTWLHACHMLPIPAPSLGGTHVIGVPCLGMGG